MQYTPSSYSAQMFNPYMNNMVNYPTNTKFPNLDFNSDDSGENIKVSIRIRPSNMTEMGRGDGKCVECMNSNTILYKNKNINRTYNYNIVFGEGTTQEDLFYTCSINV